MTGRAQSQKTAQHFYLGNRWIGETGRRTVQALDAQGTTVAVRADQVHMLQIDAGATVLGEQGVALAQARYCVYGYSMPGSLVSPLGFNGHYQDPLLEAYLLGNGHRLYSPALMRFTAPDGLSPFGRGGLNAYAYCSGDPVNRIDPSGRINIFKSNAQKTGLTAFMKSNKLPKKDVKPYLDALKSTDKEKTVDMYRLRGNEAEHFRFRSGSEGLSFDSLPGVVQYEDLSGIFFKKNDLYINLNVVDPQKVGLFLSSKGYKQLKLPEPTHVLWSPPRGQSRTRPQDEAKVIRGYENPGFS